MRAPYNVLVIPYIFAGEEVLYCVFRREDMKVWQFVAGGGEGKERHLTAAKRESFEEAGISMKNIFNKLESMCYVPVENFSEKARRNWGNRYVIPVYAYSVELSNKDIKISKEHTECTWCSYDEARDLLHFDLDKTALYELNEKLKNIK